MALSTGLLCVQIGVLNLMSIMATISIFLCTSSGEKTGIHNPYDGWQWGRNDNDEEEEETTTTTIRGRVGVYHYLRSQPTSPLL